MTKKWGNDNGDGPTTESLKRRDREVNENGVVEGKAWPAIVAGACFVGAGLVVLIMYFF